MSNNLLLVINKPDVLDNINITSHSCVDKIYKAVNGEEALDIVRTEKIDVVITAYQLDGILGDTLLLDIKSLNKNIRRIMITCYEDKNLERICEKYKITHTIIECPLTEEGLKNIINSYCSLECNEN